MNTEERIKMTNLPIFGLTISSLVCVICFSILYKRSKKSMLAKALFGTGITFILAPYVLVASIWSQYEFMPKYVHLVDIDISAPDNEVITALRKTVIENGGTCNSNICTIKVKTFEHTFRSVEINKGESSEIYCGVCDNYVTFDYQRFQFVGHVDLFNIDKN